MRTMYRLVVGSGEELIFNALGAEMTMEDSETAVLDILVDVIHEPEYTPVYQAIRIFENAELWEKINGEWKWVESYNNLHRINFPDEYIDWDAEYRNDPATWRSAK